MTHIKVLAVIAVLLFTSGLYFWATYEEVPVVDNITLEDGLGPAVEPPTVLKKAAYIEKVEQVLEQNETQKLPIEKVEPVETVEKNETPVKNITQVTDYKVKITNDLEYAKAGGETLMLDIYQPEIAGKVPLLVWYHGGGLFEGTRKGCPGPDFARKGYAMACVEYRLASMGKGCPADHLYPAQLHDAKAAIRWLRKNADKYSLDAEKVAAIGASSGGHLAALVGTTHGVAELEGTENTGYSSKVQAVVDYYGPVDMIKGPKVFTEDICNVADIGKFSQKYGGEATLYFYLTMSWSFVLGGGLGNPEIVKKAAKASPLTYVDSTDPPFLILHGVNDGMVPINQSALLADALKKAGVEVTFIRVPGAGHGYSGEDPKNPKFFDGFMKPTMEFLKKHLKQG